MNTYLILTLALLTAFGAGIVIAPFAIPFFHKIKFGQEIREEGPSWHQKKSGTPTMGGVIFILSTSVSVLIFAHGSIEAIMLVFLSVAFGIIGFVDDYIKVALKRNLGLTELQKLLLQIVAALLFVWVLKDILIQTPVIIPFTNSSFTLGWWYLPLSVLVIISAVNAVNLTDGLDGLASSITIVVALFFTCVAYFMEYISIAEFGIALVGGVGAFLLFNKYPAKIFMGDTGSLFLGGALAGMALLTGTPIFLIIAGGVFVAETVSVILQVGYYKLTKKRIFKMAPLHHHFEMCGLKETKIVIIFTLVTMLLCLISFGGFLLYLK